MSEPKLKVDPSLVPPGAQGIESFADHFPCVAEETVPDSVVQGNFGESKVVPPSVDLRPAVSQLGVPQTAVKKSPPAKKVDPWAKRRPARIIEYETFIGHDPETFEEIEFSFFGTFLDGVEMQEWQERGQTLCSALLIPNPDGSPQYYPAPGGAPIKLNQKTILAITFMELCQELAKPGPEFVYSFHELVGLAINQGGVFSEAVMWYNQFMPSAERKSEIRDKLGNLGGSPTV